MFAQPLTTGRVLAESDLYDSYLPLFRSPLLVWSSFEFGGVPAFADPENSAFYPVRFLFAQVFHWWNGFIVAAYILAGCFIYAYLFVRTRSRTAAALGGVAFVLSEAMLERVPHANIIHAIAWVPLILLAIDQMRTSRAWPWWTAVAGFAGACCLLAGHPQFALYSAYLCGAYAVTGLILERAGLVHWLRLAGASALALLLSAPMLVPLVELSRYSVRQTVGFTDFIDYANTPWQMLAVVFPAIAHHGLEAPTYVGLAVLLCALVGAAQLGSNWRLGFWLVVAVIGLALGAGDATPLARVAYALPLYDRFRITSRHLVFAALALDILAAYGAAAMQQRRVSMPRLTTAACLFVALVATATVLLAGHPDAVFFDSGSVPTWFGFRDPVTSQLIIAVVTLLAVAIVWRRYPHAPLASALILTVVAADLLGSSSYAWTTQGLSMVTVDPAQTIPDAHARALGADLAMSNQRFLSVPDSLRDEVVPAMFARAWGIPSAGGYTSLLLQDMALLSGIAPNGRIAPAALSDGDLALDLLAVKYVVARRDQVDAATFHAPRWERRREFEVNRQPASGASALPSTPHAYELIENARALPRAWVAAEVLPTTDGTMTDAIHTSRFRDGRPFDPRETALVFEGDVAAVRYAVHGDATVVSVADSSIAIAVDAPAGGFLVLSEAYYPGWTARVDDGASQAVARTDLALQGITVPPGRHLVHFEFNSRTRQVGFALGAAGTLALFTTVVIGWRTSRS